MSQHSISIIVKSIASLDLTILSDLPEDLSYESGDALSIVEELTYHIEKFKKEGHTSFEVKVSKCNFCYPNSNTFSFHSKETTDEKLRYVMDTLPNEENNIIFSHCLNRPKIQDGKDGMPF
jgi:hypothetical protein